MGDRKPETRSALHPTAKNLVIGWLRAAIDARLLGTASRAKREVLSDLAMLHRVTCNQNSIHRSSILQSVYYVVFAIRNTNTTFAILGNDNVTC